MIFSDFAEHLNHTVITSDYQEGLADASLQVLAILLNHEPSALVTSPPGQRRTNAFVNYLQAVVAEPDLSFIYEALVRLLNNPLMVNSSYLPNSQKSVGCHKGMDSCIAIDQ